MAHIIILWIIGDTKLKLNIKIEKRKQRIKNDFKKWKTKFKNKYWQMKIIVIT